MRLLKFAFIGCGKIAHFHADVVKYLGHSIDVVVARKNSVNIDSFAEKYSVKEKLYSIESFLNYYQSADNEIDCILVCSPWDVTEDILKDILTCNLPVISEKPAVLSINRFNQLKQSPNINNLFVAYNRRFYDFIPALKELLDKEKILCVDILSADPYEMIVKTNGDKIKNYIFHYYTSHVIDFMMYLLGDIKIRNIRNLGVNSNKFWLCNLCAVENKYPIEMKILMDCPQNTYFKIFFEKKVVEIKPFERMVIYDELERKENSTGAVYLPSVQVAAETDKTFKPGFLNQMRFFVENFVYKKNLEDIYIKQLEKVTVFCDALKKNMF